MELTKEEKLAVLMGLLELGATNSHYEINDFKRCTNPTCETGYFVSATSRIKLIKCPHCGYVRERMLLKV